MFFETSFPRILYLMFATANGENRVLPWIRMCKVRVKLNKIGTSALLATVKSLNLSVE